MKPTHTTKLLLVATCVLLATAYLAPAQTLPTEPNETKYCFEPMHIVEFSDGADGFGYTPSQIRTAYNLPSSGGSGVTIAIIVAYDTPNIKDYLTIFSAEFGLPLPDDSNFEVHKMADDIAYEGNWSREACLDVEWAHAIAPQAKILLVEATDNSPALFDAINYAISRPDVAAVSMSWGIEEMYEIIGWDSIFESSPDVVFFASTGDDGAGVTYWPATSPDVVAVGGTTLNLDTDGSVISETGWSGSGGNMSAYMDKPAYQTSYGLTSINRTIPDVSYDGDPSTGFPVYWDSSWHKIGGTSAGVPQWAAIYALDRSATSTNLYETAKTSYSSAFRDITSGSNGYSAGVGYDFATGLGSPLTYDFGSTLQVTPSEGPAGAAVSLNGESFTTGSTVDIEYLNPTTSTWTLIVEDLPTSAGGFTYSTTAPDLLQNNPAGDNTALYENVIFKATDNSNGHTYNTTMPYTEWRRGINQVGSEEATGLFGNNTDLSSTVFVQNGQSLTVAGEWFNPGTATLTWDDSASLGTAAIDATGSFTATVTAPTSAAGRHKLTVNDGASDFCLTLTRLPEVSDDYSDGWHTVDFIVNLASDYGGTEIHYKVNGGATQNVASNGQPQITGEGSGNTLEYWGVWDVYGSGSKELTHVTLTGLKLDKTAPSGSVTADSPTSTSTITLHLSASDSASGVAQMRFSNDASSWSSWESYSTTKTWTLEGGDGDKTVYAQFIDGAGLSSQCSCTITLESEPTPTPTASSTPTPTPVPSGGLDPSALPEAPQFMVVAAVVFAASMLVLVLKRKERSS